MQDDSHDLGSAESGLDDLHTLAGAGPMTSDKRICVFNRPRYCDVWFCLWPRYLVRLMPLIFLALALLSGLTFLRIFVTGEVLIVRARLNDAWPAFFFLVILAAILLATSIGLLQVAGSATIRPLRGPDVQRNFLLILGAEVPCLSRANTPLDASSTPSNSS